MYANDSYKHSKSWMHQDIMKLRGILGKFHIWHVQNGATIQQLQPTKVIVVIFPKQQHGILYTKTTSYMILKCSNKTCGSSGQDAQQHPTK